MFIAKISVLNGATADVNSVKQQLIDQLDWSALITAFVRQYVHLTPDIELEVRESDRYEELADAIVVIVADSATHLLQNIVRWITNTQDHVNKTVTVGSVTVNINGLRVAYRYGKYERQADDPYQPGRLVTGVYLNGGLGMKQHTLTCIARDYVNLGTVKCDGDFVTAWSASAYFPANDAEKWGLPTSIFA